MHHDSSCCKPPCSSYTWTVSRCQFQCTQEVLCQVVLKRLLENVMTGVRTWKRVNKFGHCLVGAKPNSQLNIQTNPWCRLVTSTENTEVRASVVVPARDGSVNSQSLKLFGRVEHLLLQILLGGTLLLSSMAHRIGSTFVLPLGKRPFGQFVTSWTIATDRQNKTGIEPEPVSNNTWCARGWQKSDGAENESHASDFPFGPRDGKESCKAITFIQWRFLF